ncbi:MAG: hypothetical protein NC833_04585 [Candidatus Omnitrophica bacterium]|nr:hypothetical protein [Candidatus Omnitrophota bacterium]
MMIESQNHKQKKQDQNLYFTGNWFIDVGILGFVNLMEKVYGWDLDTLQEKIAKEPEKVYYGYFPLGYLMYNSRIRTVINEINDIRTELKNGLQIKLRESQKKLDGLINERKKIETTKKPSELKSHDKKIVKEKGEIDRLKNEIDIREEEIFKKETSLKDELNQFRKNIENKISNITSNVEGSKKDISPLINEFELKLPKDHRNFFIYNSKNFKNNLYNSFIYLWHLLKEDYKALYNFTSKISSNKKKEGLTYEIRPDSTINPFLYSPIEFPNIGYTNLPKVSAINNALNLRYPLYLLLLSFGNSFQFIGDRNIMFYTNSLEGAYVINKKLVLYQEREMKKRRTEMFQITWRAIIDTLIEKKADFSLENMYIIEFSRIENLKLKDVEFIGIPKLQASILLDDMIRGALNNRVQFRSKNFKRNRSCWLLEEFIKGKPLYPIIFSHIKLVLNENENVNCNWYASLYSLIIDAKILEFKSRNKKGTLFSEDYFDNYQSLIKAIKEDIKITSYSASLINQISKNREEKSRLARELLDALKAKDKNIFLNILLKNINEEKELCANFHLNNWIFDKIVSNNISFEMYGLILVMNLLEVRR